MATYRISELSAVTSVSSTALLEISEVSATGYSSKKATAAQLKSYIQEGITAVATVSAGTWQANPIDVAYGGTGATTTVSALNKLLPDQTGNANLFLGTDGSTATWRPYALNGPAATTQIFVAVTSEATAGSVSVRSTLNDVLIQASALSSAAWASITAHTYKVGETVYLFLVSGTAVPLYQTYHNIVQVTTNGIRFEANYVDEFRSGRYNIISSSEVSVNNYAYTSLSSGLRITDLYKIDGIPFIKCYAITSVVTSSVFRVFPVGSTLTPLVPTNGGAVYRVATTTNQTWNKPAGCRSITVEVVGAGANIVAIATAGGGGGYAKKTINVSAVSSVEVFVGWGGTAGPVVAQPSRFGTYVCAVPASGGNPGYGVGGDINLAGASVGTSFLGQVYTPYGNSFGAGGISHVSASNLVIYPHDDPRSPKPGIVIVTEYY